MNVNMSSKINCIECECRRTRKRRNRIGMEMSQLVTRYTGAKCPNCRSCVPPLERDGNGWGTIDCSNCDNWFNIYKYEKAGGKPE